MKKPESKLQRHIRKELETKVGGFWFKVHGGIFQMPGLPDLIGCVEGLFMGLEVKRGSKEPTKLQQITIKLIRSQGGYASTVRSSEEAVRKVRRWLRKSGKTIKNKTLEFPAGSRQVRLLKGKRRLIYGDGDR